jgi:uncharacterized repeat protein (TIGR04052 family)
VRLAPILLVTGCALAPAGAPLAVSFRAVVGDAPYECGRTYAGLGRDGGTYRAEDLRFYVHDLRLVTAYGEEIPLVLEADGRWQDRDVALLDFETDCLGGTPEVNGMVRARAELASDAEVTALRFRLGVPPGRNHLAAASQPPPLNVTGLFWGWQAGYQYLSALGTTDAGLSVFMLGAMGCSGDARMGTRRCAAENRVEIELAVEGLEALAAGAVVADVAALYAEIDTVVDGGSVLGCESLASDPECGPMFEAIGLDLAGRGLGRQSFFRFEPR